MNHELIELVWLRACNRCEYCHFPAEVAWLRFKSWSKHFQWQGNSLNGRTPTGRATIAVLRINSPDALEFRALLLDSGYQL